MKNKILCMTVFGFATAGIWMGTDPVARCASVPPSPTPTPVKEKPSRKGKKSVPPQTTVILPPPSTTGEPFPISSSPSSRYGTVPDIPSESGVGTGGGAENDNGIGSGSGISDGTGTAPARTEVPKRSGNVPLRLLFKPSATYTDDARNNNVNGTVVLKVQFKANGTIGLVTPMSRLPYGLTEQAMAAARRIKFEPSRKNGKPITIVKTIQYGFSIY